MTLERDVSLQWRKIFAGQALTAETLSKAQTLLDGLSEENPLRARLNKELDELRRLAEPKQAPVPRKPRDHDKRQKRG